MPRQVAMYLCREILAIPLKNVGQYLGNRDHTTVMHGVEKIEKELQNNEQLKNTIETFSALGARLLGFGDDDATRAVIDSACRVNGWFTPADIRRAVRAIACDMLQREKLEAWLADYPALPVAEPRRVLVVMAGNIPLVGFFDLLCVLVSGHGCLVKPSAKDSVLMEHVVGLLREIDPSAPVRLYDGTSSVDAVIATGSDNANRYFRAHYAGIPSLLRAAASR